MPKVTTGLRNFVLDGFGPAFDGGTAVLEVRSGSMPANAGDALTGTVLASLSVPSDAFGAAASAQVVKNGTWQDTSADAGGTAGYAVLRFAGDTAGADDTVRRILFSVGTSGAELNFDNLVINVGQQVTLNTLSFTWPGA